MLLLAAIVVSLWICGSLLAVSLCWAASRGDACELVAAQERRAAQEAALDERGLGLALA